MARSKTTRLVAPEGVSLSALGRILDAIETTFQPQSTHQRPSSVVDRGLSVENGEAIRLADSVRKNSPNRPPEAKQEQSAPQRPAPSPEALQAARDEMRRFISAFGVKRGGEYFAAGLTSAEARERYRADTEPERRALSVNAGLGKNLADFAMGCKPPGQR
jgi:hypothetical protein